MNSKIIISGNIISELSEKIPSNIIALNELVKNAYDAGADEVTIKIDSNRKKLIITDDGSGMDKNDIDVLLHLSKSEKKYGEKNKYERYTQGSKGLGFLSVFKFGKYVSWKTKKHIGLQFSIDYSDLVNSDDITSYNVDVIENNDITKGTEIEIDLSEYNLQSLLQYFSDEKNYKKIIHSFYDESFIIKIVIDENEAYCSNNKENNKEKISLEEILPESQLCKVKYDSSKGEIEYYYPNFKYDLTEGKVKYYYDTEPVHSLDYSFKSTAYTLEIELVIFKLKRNQKSEINKLFYNPNDELTPLIYINSNLFNNYDIFDPNIMQKIKYESILNQMIGYIRIISSDSMMNFNSDRTQFLQNQLTDEIKEFLRNINKEIQKIGSQYGKYLTKLNFLKDTKPVDGSTCIEDLRKNIKDDFKFKNKVIIAKKESKVIYSIFGKEVSIDIRKTNGVDNKEDKQKGKEKLENEDRPCLDGKQNMVPNINIIPAKIILFKRKIKVEIPSTQMNLRDQIKEAINSSGEFIDKTHIQIKVDSNLLDTGIVPSVTFPCFKSIEFSYLDIQTGPVNEIMEIEFYQAITPIRTPKIRERLLSLPTKKGYSMTFNPIISKLVNQLNDLDIDKYEQVIACSLRAIFEICTDAVIKSDKFQHLKLLDNTQLEKRVYIIVEYVKDNNKILTSISNSSAIDYNSLKNVLFPEDFEKFIKKAHLGAHKSTTYISQLDIKALASKAAFFMVLTNEMISNSSIA